MQNVSAYGGGRKKLLTQMAHPVTNMGEMGLKQNLAAYKSILILANIYQLIESTPFCRKANDLWNKTC